MLLTACQRSQNTGWINNAQSKQFQSGPTYTLPGGGGNTANNNTKWQGPTGPSQNPMLKTWGTRCYKCLAELWVLLATNCDCAVALCSFRYSVLMHTHNPNSWEVEAGRSGIKANLTQQHSEFKVSMTTGDWRQQNPKSKNTGQLCSIAGTYMGEEEPTPWPLRHTSERAHAHKYTLTRN